MINRKHRQKGFTLIELMVAMVIMGILAGIVVVSTSGARTRSNFRTVLADMVAIQLYASLYYGELDNGIARANYGSSYTEDDCNVSVTNVFKEDSRVRDLVGRIVKKRPAGLKIVCNVGKNIGGVPGASYLIALVNTTGDPLPSGTSIWCVDDSGYSGEASPVLLTFGAYTAVRCSAIANFCTKPGSGVVPECSS